MPNNAGRKTQKQCAKEELTKAYEEITGTTFDMEREYKFWPGRRFRLDFAKPEWKLAIEVEGVVWRGKGRHQTPTGMQSDCEKYNELAIQGWLLLRFTTDMIRKQPNECVETIIRAAYRLLDMKQIESSSSA
jgi:very-short-patch-repair endonuclease